MQANLPSLINTFTDRHIAVIGEAILDSYLTGSAQRLCAEAPVPVVTLNDRRDIPGGAANTALNLRSLGAQVSLLSVIGNDDEGNLLRQALARAGVKTEAVLVQPARRTLVKQRVIAASQMLVRVDQGSTDAIAPVLEAQLIDHLDRLFSQCDAVIISDYGYGILTPRIIQAMNFRQAYSPQLLVVDGKRLASYRAVGVTIVKPNYEEALRLLSAHVTNAAIDTASGETRADHIAQYSEQLLDITGAEIAVVTLDAEGAVILQRGCAPSRLYAKSAACANTTGAGDTFISTLTLALTAGATLMTAADLAMTAAAIVVTKEHTATCSARELQALHVSQIHTLKALNEVA